MKSKLAKSRFENLFKILGAALVIGLGVFWAAHHAHAQTPTGNGLTSPPTAGVAKVAREDLYKEVTIAAEFRPFAEVALHAKVSGYVSKMNVDFGDKVKAGQLLATLEVPELQDELENAQAAEQKAMADYTNAHLIFMRLQSVNKDRPNLVAQQDLDTIQANDLTTAAALAAAKANFEKYQTMVGYTQITAPFDGVVTHRYADPGTLIQAGTSSDTQALPLVRVSDNYRLRLDFPVTVDYVKDIQLGDAVEVKVDSLEGKTFTGTISRFTHQVDDNTRTMITEIEVPNPDLKLMPGMYATVILKVEKRLQTLAVPTEAVTGEKKPTVYVVNHDNQIEERPVKLGLETADQYEILSGLQEGDLVVIGNRSGLQAGQKVEPKLIELSLRDEELKPSHG
ncbi:MAG TPA: efflux RND transporter periplasmic adaptor subunit [Verrucomicrobiae bacterium]|nr:efflux RND transporter periplasmic adaptor subunit [Verrucomicrobiae bacterium]